MSTYLFHVLEPRKRNFVIEWRLLEEERTKEYGHLSAFLYWAEGQGATYRIRPALTFGSPVRKPLVELQAISGTYGEYSDKIFWQPGCIFRVLSGTHYLTQHGLDGLPRAYFDRLWRTTQPIFRIEPYRGGVFSMTLEDWFHHFSGGKNEDGLAALASQIAML